MTPLPSTWPWQKSTSTKPRPLPTEQHPTPTCTTSQPATQPATGSRPAVPIGSAPSGRSSASCSIIRRTVHGLWHPHRQMFLLTLRDGIPAWTDSPARAATWFTEDGARRIARLIAEPLAMVPIRYVRPAADPLGWEVDDE